MEAREGRYARKKLNECMLKNENYIIKIMIFTMHTPAAGEVTCMSRQLTRNPHVALARLERIDWAHVVKSPARNKVAGRRIRACHHPWGSKRDRVNLIQYNHSSFVDSFHSDYNCMLYSSSYSYVTRREGEKRAVPILLKTLLSPIVRTSNTCTNFRFYNLKNCFPL